MEEALRANQLAMQEMEKSWEQKLKEAKEKEEIKQQEEQKNKTNSTLP